ncbi:MAG TPA: hypothetical protein ENN91_00515, partial [Firmicutes bacterium]|nr:hypothetical protein [Bacillota bacterium]
MTIVNAKGWPDEYLGLPGDNLNLYAVMKLFQESETLEGFERALNDENSRINNLDLNGDYLVDYITVSDYVDRNVHTIVLRAVLNRYESQDVAVFTVEKFRNGSVQIQLIGDEALYGRNYIIEPIYAETRNPGYIGTTIKQKKHVTVITTNYYEVAAWPVIRYIYHPHYVVWRSAWYWGYYPVYWYAWSPYYWHYYYGYHYHWHAHYYKHYHHWNHYRYSGYNNFYYASIRKYSPTVVININKGNYKSTYSRPELRSEGEALYTRTLAARSAESRTGSTVTSRERNSSESQSIRVNDNARHTAESASRATTVTARNESGTAVSRNTTPASRTTTTATARSEAGTAVSRNTEAASRTTTTVTNRSEAGT